MDTQSDYPPYRTATCRACQANGCDHLHTQRFVLPDAAEPLSYDVVTCRRCGFVFADEIPAPEILDEHYGAAEHHLHSNLPDGLRRIHSDFFIFLRDHLNLTTSTRVLDVGSGMGHFLKHFKAAGHEQIVGLEPSRRARELAHSVYGIDVVTQTVGSYQAERPFDLVTMCGVLEHIADLASTLKAVHELTRTGGHLFVAVPDAMRFGESSSAEPFLEFAFEHINFFTEKSLTDLLQRNGFDAVCVESRHNGFYDNHYLYALFKSTTRTSSPEPRVDPHGASMVRRYVDNSNRRLSAVRSGIELLAERAEPVIIWGAGSLAARLCATTPVNRLKVLSFIDSNQELQNKSILGVPIRSPEWLRQTDRTSPVLIFSTTYDTEIERILLDRYAWKGGIHRLNRMEAIQ